MLILQVILSIIAWFRGWKWYALIPLTVGVISSILFKYIIINLTDPLTLKLIASIIGVIINIVLLIMSIRTPKKEDAGQEEELQDNSKDIEIDKENKIVKEDINEEIENEQNIVLEVIEEVQHNSEKKSIGCESPNEVIQTKKYYYAKGRNKKGPYTEDELVKLKLKPKTLIWTDGLDKWQPLSDFDGIIKTPPPLPNKVLPNNAKSKKRLIVSLVILVLFFGISLVSTYYIMENRRATYLSLMNDEIDKIFDGKITLCEGEEYRTSGELRPVSEPTKSPDKSQDTYDKEIEAYQKDIQTGAIERFHSKGIIFEYQKLIRTSSGFRVEELWSDDMVYFYKATIQSGSSPPRRLVTPEEAYANCYQGIIKENSECLSEGLSDKLSYLEGLRNKYFQISFRNWRQLTGGSRGNDYYEVYYERSNQDYFIKDRSSLKQDFIKTLAMFGGISIILAVLLFILNPFKW